MFIYEQGSGRLLHRSGDSVRLIATGYAGAPACIDDPAKDHIHQCGPLPKGTYRCRVLKHPRFAAPAIKLDPEKGTRMYRRSGFYIHGDNDRGDRSASSGCIIVGKQAREYVARWIAEGDDCLLVLAGGEHEAHQGLARPVHASAVAAIQPATLRARAGYVVRA